MKLVLGCAAPSIGYAFIQADLKKGCFEFPLYISFPLSYNCVDQSNTKHIVCSILVEYSSSH